VQLLDPTGRLFGDRVISQLDSTRRNTKDLDVVLGAESAVVILDDTEGVILTSLFKPED
jgi:RNA polymerase II C-terminal domain phosphatase-like 3/4